MGSVGCRREEIKVSSQQPVNSRVQHLGQRKEAWQEEVLDGIQVNPVPSLGAGILGHQGMGGEEVVVLVGSTSHLSRRSEKL